MGNFCSCESNDKINEFLSLEFLNHPSDKTIVGTAIFEEAFIESNMDLHNFDFAKSFSKAKRKERSKSIKSYSKQNKRNDSYQISLFRSVQEYSKEEDDISQIIFEGELLKYRPGISTEYTPRWCRLTYEGFAYYKNQWTATCSNKTPLVFIPIIQIKEITLINRPGKRELVLFEFEIYLSEEEELTKLSRSTNGFTIRPNITVNEKVPANWWSVRQIEWYSAERRLLFASKSLSIVQNWVEALTKLSESINYNV